MLEGTASAVNFDSAALRGSTYPSMEVLLEVPSVICMMVVGALYDDTQPVHTVLP